MRPFFGFTRYHSIDHVEYFTRVNGDRVEIIQRDRVPRFFTSKGWQTWRDSLVSSHASAWACGRAFTRIVARLEVAS